MCVRSEECVCGGGWFHHVSSLSQQRRMNHHTHEEVRELDSHLVCGLNRFHNPEHSKMFQKPLNVYGRSLHFQHWIFRDSVFGSEEFTLCAFSRWRETHRRLRVHLPTSSSPPYSSSSLHVLVYIPLMERFITSPSPSCFLFIFRLDSEVLNFTRRPSPALLVPVKCVECVNVCSLLIYSHPERETEHTDHGKELWPSQQMPKKLNTLQKDSAFTFYPSHTHTHKVRAYSLSTKKACVCVCGFHGDSVGFALYPGALKPVSAPLCF